MNTHDVIVQRSRALHQAVAEKIRAKPELLNIARAHVERWIAEQEKNGAISPALLEWKRILETRSLDDVLQIICSEGEKAERLRHATPFCAILTEDERNAVYHAYAASPA